jgi:hypothetical protein
VEVVDGMAYFCLLEQFSFGGVLVVHEYTSREDQIHRDKEKTDTGKWNGENVTREYVTSKIVMG